MTRRSRKRTVHVGTAGETDSAGDVSLVVLRKFAPAWYSDAFAEAAKELGDVHARRREIVAAACCVDSYLYEWVRDNLAEWMGAAGQDPDRRWAELFGIFPDPDRRGVQARWQEVPRDLYERGYIPARPQLGGPHGEDFKRLVTWRDGLVHGKVSRPERHPVQLDQLAVPTADELRSCQPGWALSVVTDRIARLHAAVGTEPPGWLQQSELSPATPDEPHE